MLVSPTQNSGPDARYLAFWWNIGLNLIFLALGYGCNCYVDAATFATKCLVFLGLILVKNGVLFTISGLEVAD